MIRIARPTKRKTVCGIPEVSEFIQRGEQGEGLDIVFLTLEEYETIRLIDKERMTHEECAEQMEISRPSVTLLYSSAREKLAEFLIEGGMLKIQGGHYKLCQGKHKGCCRRKCHQEEKEEN